MGNAIYAGPLLSVSSFCVNYPFTFRTAEPALEAVKKYQVPMAYGCLWHDDGGECCDWLGLLGMQYYAESAYRQGPVGREVLDARFAACTGSCAEWFTDAGFLDAVPCSNPENRWPPNPISPDPAPPRDPDRHAWGNCMKTACRCKGQSPALSPEPGHADAGLNRPVPEEPDGHRRHGRDPRTGGRAVQAEERSP